MAERPAIFVTRKLPEAVTARLLHSYRATLNPEDGPISGPELVAGAVAHDALLISSREAMTAETLAALPSSIRAIATFSVGFEHIDLAAAQARSLVVTNTPDVLTDATADIAMLLILGAARGAGEASAWCATTAGRGWAWRKCWAARSAASGWESSAWDESAVRSPGARAAST
jgi:lactate dehydrogenase-like 2-hydroxyacid dehydrogenase